MHCIACTHATICSGGTGPTPLRPLCNWAGRLPCAHTKAIANRATAGEPVPGWESKHARKHLTASAADGERQNTQTQMTPRREHPPCPVSRLKVYPPDAQIHTTAIRFLRLHHPTLTTRHTAPAARHVCLPTQPHLQACTHFTGPLQCNLSYPHSSSQAILLHHSHQGSDPTPPSHPCPPLEAA